MTRGNLSATGSRLVVALVVALVALTLPLVGVTPGSGSSLLTRTAAPSSPTVVLDPGHNGQNYRNTSKINRLVDIGTKRKACNTTGTVSLDGTTEAAYNLSVALRTKQLLEDAGVTVVLTRSSNDGWGPCIDDRARTANDVHATALISIHADGGPPSGRGFVVIHPRKAKGLANQAVDSSAELARLLVVSLSDRTRTSPSTYLGRNGLLASSDYGTLNLAQVPSVIVETANMRNRTDSELVGSPEFQDAVAESIATAVVTFLVRHHDLAER
jgi:N-acetylmuramoyl-L-alanine amidase